jgi:hypothetical protein
MVDNTMLRHEGKPGYTPEQLRDMTVADLKARIGKIDNQQARNIAFKLWSLLENQYRNQYGQLAISDTHSVAALNRWPRHGLLRLLEQLRRIDFGDMIAEGPQRLEEQLQSLHPFIRFLQPPARLRLSFDSAEYLLRYLEFYLDPARQIPESFIRSWIFTLGMLASYLLPAWLIYLLRDAPRRGWIFSGLVLLMILGTLLSVLAIAGHSQRRAIALYISFTDEFVNDEAGLA